MFREKNRNMFMRKNQIKKNKMYVWRKNQIGKNTMYVQGKNRIRKIDICLKKEQIIKIQCMIGKKID